MIHQVEILHEENFNRHMELVEKGEEDKDMFAEMVSLICFFGAHAQLKVELDSITARFTSSPSDFDRGGFAALKTWVSEYTESKQDRGREELQNSAAALAGFSNISEQNLIWWS